MKVLDASGVINLRDEELKGNFITVREVQEEIRDIQARMKFETASGNGGIILEEPSNKAVEWVKGLAERNGILPLLSVPDLKVLALAYEKNLPVVTDDYDIQNMCWLMGVGFETVAKPGIKGPYTWKKKCSACGREYLEDVAECEACGSRSFKVLRRD